MDNSHQALAESIVEHMSASEYRPQKIKELARAFGVYPDEYRQFRDLIKDLARQGRIARLRQSRYGLQPVAKRYEGRLKMHARGFGFVLGKGAVPDILVPAGMLNGAVDGDRVEVEIIASKRRDRQPEGRISQIVEMAASILLGTFHRRGKTEVIVPHGTGWRQDILLAGPAPAGLREGHMVRCRLLRGRGHLEAEIDKVLGDPADPSLDFYRIVQELELPLDFSDEVLQEVDGIGLDLAAAATTRTDLRDQVCFTIDPEAAQDFDDGVSLEKSPEGHWRLGVHIADVSHYIKPGSALDQAALERGTSVYLLDRAIPMLPHRLSGDICTLAPGQDRLALSVLIELEPGGDLVDFEIKPSIMRSSVRLTYKQVQDEFDRGPQGAARPWRDQLLEMRRLSRKLKEKRRSRGALDFELAEAQVVLDKGGKPTELGRYPRYESHQLIEEFMLLANECVARFVSEHQYPVLYRVHAAPDQAKLQPLIDLAQQMGLKLDRHRSVRPLDLQNLLSSMEQRQEGPLVNQLLLRAMKRAEYSADNIGHYGLAAEHYLHFTSPIRRYPDLLVHRVVKAALAGRLDDEGIAALHQQMGTLAVQTSATERRAVEAERSYIRLKQLRFMARRVGRRYGGLVAGVTRGALFVEVGDWKVDGYCRLQGAGDTYQLDERGFRLVGRRTKKVFTLGTPVQVQVAGVDLDLRRLDLTLVSGGQEQRPSRKTKRLRPAKRRRKRN